MRQYVNEKVVIAMATSALINLLADLWAKWSGGRGSRARKDGSQLSAGVASIFRGGLDLGKIVAGVVKIIVALAGRARGEARNASSRPGQ